MKIDENALWYVSFVTDLTPVMHTSWSFQPDLEIHKMRSLMRSGFRNAASEAAGTTKTSRYIPHNTFSALLSSYSRRLLYVAGIFLLPLIQTDANCYLATVYLRSQVPTLKHRSHRSPSTSPYHSQLSNRNMFRMPPCSGVPDLCRRSDPANINAQHAAFLS